MTVRTPSDLAVARDVVVPGIERLQTVTLDELCALPDLQTRIDRKYVVPHQDATWLLGGLTGHAALEIGDRTALAYESVYFDTPDLACFRAAAHGRRHRFKVRTRTYLDTRVCLVEAKTAGSRGETVKRRAPYPFADRGGLLDEARLVLEEWLGPELPELVPTLVTTYWRTTFVDRSTGSRITLDADVRATTTDGRSSAVCHGLLVETKTTGAATPTDRLLWAHGIRPARISKYAVGLAALTPELRANRWHRAVVAARS